MLDRLRTIVIALCVAPLALPVSACGGGGPVDTRTKRVVCTNQAKEVVHDDFATDEWAGAEDGFYVYTSATQDGRMAVSGQCVGYPAARPAGWKPIIQGIAS